MTNVTLEFEQYEKIEFKKIKVAIPLKIKKLTTGYTRSIMLSLLITH